ncbi:hypothetical protein PLANPX_1039 [Lacipirellula parvula]|uniref:Uncharacterized protein n=1 Tax=Lacipirellula parvula TaxID=2650471 RepID=A0A5K7X6G0_9BACT|nr:hypothetical protein PLANPX_1039 [Lacipirellula parvula]
MESQSRESNRGAPFLVKEAGMRRVWPLAFARELTALRARNASNHGSVNGPQSLRRLGRRRGLGASNCR